MLLTIVGPESDALKNSAERRQTDEHQPDGAHHCGRPTTIACGISQRRGSNPRRSRLHAPAASPEQTLPESGGLPNTMAPKPPNHANPLRVAAAQGNGRIAARSRNRRLVPARLAADEHWRPLGQPGVKGLAGSLRSVGERAALCARFERSSPTAVRFRPRGAMVHRGGSGVVRWLSTKRWLAPPPPWVRTCAAAWAR